MGPMYDLSNTTSRAGQKISTRSNLTDLTVKIMIYYDLIYVLVCNGLKKLETSILIGLFG